jgi:ankyrin repeat protein/Tol biopolymer transport system component
MKKVPVSAFFGIILLAWAFSAQDIFQVIRNGDVEKLKVLLEKNPALANTPHPFGYYPIHLAALSGRLELVESLIERGADVRVTFREGTVLHAAIYSGSQDVLELLISKGVNLDAGSESSGPPLLLAARLGRSEMAEKLLARGASMNLKDKVGNTALLLAASCGHKPVVELLLEKNGDFNAPNSHGATPLSVAEREGHEEIVRVLLAKGAKRGAAGLPDLKGEYLGQRKPGMKPELFAPDIVSTEKNELNAVFAPDEKEFYFTRRSSSPGGSGTIMFMEDQNGRWTRPRSASFSGTYSDVDMFISRNGEELFFCSNRPLPGDKEPKKDTDIWVVRRKGSGWDKPRHLGWPVNSDRNDYYPTLTHSGTLYFSSHREGSKGENDIFRAEYADGGYAAPANLGDAINTEYREFDPFIAPDESFLIFSSGRPGGRGEADLYISFRRSDGTWSQAQNMGEAVNSSASDYTPMLSPDGKYLFFTSGRAGVDDIYWVDAGILRKFRPS